MSEWSLQDVKNRFSAVVNAALDGAPQMVTRRGKPAVVVLAVEDYERLCRVEKASAPTFIEHLLAIPKGSDDDGFELPYRTRPYARLHAQGRRSLNVPQWPFYKPRSLVQ